MFETDAALVAALRPLGATDSRVCGCGGNRILGCSLHDNHRTERTTVPAPINNWDRPVIAALDTIEALPGFAPERIQWDNFRFYGTSQHRMDSVSIYAYPADGTPSFRFAHSLNGTRDISATGSRDVAVALVVSDDAAQRALELLQDALRGALTEWNTAHASS